MDILSKHRQGPNSKREDCESGTDQRRGHRDFHPRRYISDAGRRLQSGKAHVQTVENESEYDHNARGEEAALSLPDLRDRQEDDRDGDADEDLGQEEASFLGVKVYKTEGATGLEIQEAKLAVEHERDQGHSTQVDQHRELDRVAEGATAEERLKDHHRAADGDRGEEEEDRQPGAVPERM